MRRSVFFAVCLGLVLSLLKEAPAETPADTTVTPSSITTENGADNKRDPDSPVEQTLEASGDGTNDVTESPEVPLAKGDGTNDVTESPESSGDGTNDVTESPEVPLAKGDGTNDVTESPESSGDGTNDVTESPEVPLAKDNSTVNGTDPSTTEMATSAPTLLEDFCHEDPCGRNSATCVSLQSNYTCVCEYGFYYHDKNCYKGEVYPATIAVNITYSENLKIVNSTEYQELHNNVSAFFKDVFKNITSYVETVIKKIQPLKQSENRNSVPGVSITVTSLFKENSNQNATSVSAAITAAIQNNGSFFSSYQAAGHCEVYECDLKTTVCEEKQFFPECKCKPGLEKTKWNDRSCPICNASCSAARHKYCVQEEEGPTCKCMINFKNEAGECVACPVGYSGEECTDNSELILIIVGAVLGAIVLCLVIAVSVISIRAKHKQNPEKRNLIRSGYSDTNTSDDRPGMFPRVQTTSGRANPGYQPNNPYEMHSRNRDHFAERGYDDLYEIPQEPRGFRTQSRY